MVCHNCGVYVSRDDKSETEVSLTVSASEIELKNVKDKTVRRLGKQVKAPGFRPGKAPLSVLENQLDNTYVQSEVLQAAVQEFYQLAIAQELLRPLAMPEVDVASFKPYKELAFKAEVEVMPKVNLSDYKKIKKTVPKITADAKEVNAVIDNLRTRAAKKHDVTGLATEGDEVIIDFEGRDQSGQTIAGASGKDYPLILGSKNFIPGFEEGLIGAVKGNQIELNLTFPKDYHAKNLAGSKINFQVMVKQVKEVALPKADNTFAASVGPFKTLEDLKKDVKSQLIGQKSNEALAKLKDEIVEQIVEESSFALPAVLVKDQITNLEQDFRQNLVYRGITLPEYLKQQNIKDEDAWRERELKPQAQRRVSIGMVLATIGEKEGIEVTPNEVNEQIGAYKQQYQQQATEFDKPEMRREVASRILTEKTVDRLVKLATGKS